MKDEDRPWTELNQLTQLELIDLIWLTLWMDVNTQWKKWCWKENQMTNERRRKEDEPVARKRGTGRDARKRMGQRVSGTRGGNENAACGTGNRRSAESARFQLNNQLAYKRKRERNYTVSAGGSRLGDWLRPTDICTNRSICTPIHSQWRLMKNEKQAV